MGDKRRSLTPAGGCCDSGDGKNEHQLHLEAKVNVMTVELAALRSELDDPKHADGPLATSDEELVRTSPKDSRVRARLFRCRPKMVTPRTRTKTCKRCSRTCGRPLARVWRVLHAAQQQHELAVAGIYARVRHPQYVAFVVIMFGFLLQWPTLLTVIMFPILVYVYVRLARREEQMALQEFGDRYRQYMARTPAFIPSRSNAGKTAAG